MFIQLSSKADDSVTTERSRLKFKKKTAVISQRQRNDRHLSMLSDGRKKKDMNRWISVYSYFFTDDEKAKYAVCWMRTSYQEESTHDLVHIDLQSSCQRPMLRSKARNSSNPYETFQGCRLVGNTNRRIIEQLRLVIRLVAIMALVQG